MLQNVISVESYNFRRMEILQITQESKHFPLLSRSFSSYQLKISIDKKSRLRGWLIKDAIREVEIKGLPAYLPLQIATHLLKQSYLKLHKEAIEVLPQGFGGMKRQKSPSVLPPEKVKLLKEEALQLVEAIANEKKKKGVQKALTILFGNNPEKTNLHFKRNQISDIGAQVLAAALHVNHTIQSLNFGHNQIGTAGAQALSTALQINQSIQSLDLSYNNVGNIGAQALAAALHVNQSIQSLDLSYNNVGDIGAQALAAALHVNQSIQSLNLSYNNVGDIGAQALAAALHVNQSIQSLNLTYSRIQSVFDFGHNQIGDIGAQAIAAALYVNQSIQELYFAHNRIGNEGAQAIGAALQINQSLQLLDLKRNKIGAVGTQALGTALQVNQSLKQLHLQQNRIGDTGVLALSEALQVNHTIQKLDLYLNAIGNNGALALGAALQVNQSLQSLHLANNRIGTAGAQALGKALQVNHTIQKLDLYLNEIDDDGAQALGAALQVNQSLQWLHLANNRIGTAGAQALGIALQVNQSLEWLQLEQNRISDAGALAIAAALQVNHTIQQLFIDDNYFSDIGMSTTLRINTLLDANKHMATIFQQQLTKVQNFLTLYPNEESIPLEHLPQLQKLLRDSTTLIPCLEQILKQSGRTELNSLYRKKLKDVTNHLHNLLLESFERKIATLSNKYVMGKEPSEERNVDLGSALYKTWLTFFGAHCPNWLEDHLETLLPFGVLLDIAEGGKKQDITDLTDARLLFERVLSFKNESKDSYLFRYSKMQFF